MHFKNGFNTEDVTDKGTDLGAIRKPAMTELVFSMGERENISCAKRTEKNLFPYSPIHLLPSKRVAFTLAETLITLGIIGVVAAITIPSITANYRRQEMIGRLKKTYSVLSQAFLISKNENGVLADWDTSNGKKYFEQYWKNYIKGISECKTVGCGYDKIDDAGADYVWRYLSGSMAWTSVYPSSTRYSAVLADGTFLMFMLRTETSAAEKVNRIYVDINGYKKPNTFGKDVFIFQLTDKGLVPYGIEKSDEEVKADCNKNNKNKYSGGMYCAVLLYKNGWKVPDDYPW